MQSPLCLDWFAKRTSNQSYAICSTKSFESSFATVGERTFNAIVTELPTRVTNRRGDLCGGRSAPKLVDCRQNFHTVRLEDSQPR
jgi:hypothetical protein